MIFPPPGVRFSFPVGKLLFVRQKHLKLFPFVKSSLRLPDSGDRSFIRDPNALCVPCHGSEHTGHLSVSPGDCDTCPPGSWLTQGLGVVCAQRVFTGRGRMNTHTVHEHCPTVLV